MSVQVLINDYKKIKHSIKEVTDLPIDSPSGLGLPRSKGVYVACQVTEGKGVEVVYIGSSKDMYGRTKSNTHPINLYHDGCCNFLYVECENYRKLEKCLIKKFKPAYNVEFTRGRV